jgi:signal transduction histidine kinase
MNITSARLTKMIYACQAWYQRNIHLFYVNYLAPKSVSEDDKRGERILTLILFFILLLTSIFGIGLSIQFAKLGSDYHGVPIILYLCFALLAIYLYLITRQGYYKIAGYLLITILLCIAIYASYQWGASLPMGLLTYGLIVSIASIVINSRFGFTIAIISCIALIIVGLREHSSQILPEWKQGVIEKYDILGYGIMIGLTALLSRLSNKEMEKSLQRARASEQALKEERDNLEITVQERTKELRESERERMRELYRFAEFGKLSGGIFHDLLNPLTAVSLSVAKLSNDPTMAKESEEVTATLKTAVSATKRMEQFMATVKKQIQTNDMRGVFSLNQEIEDAIDLIKHKAIKAKATILFESENNFSTYGNPLKFNQAITNLIVNAIDANASSVTITLADENKSTICRVTDTGSGIPPETLGKIFNPFFTTKDKGIGLGLSTTKDIIEEHFGGTLICTSTIGVGTTFTISIPQNNNTHEQNHPANH